MANNLIGFLIDDTVEQSQKIHNLTLSSWNEGFIGWAMFLCRLIQQNYDLSFMYDDGQISTTGFKA